MVLYQVAGYQQGGMRAPDIFSFGIFLTKEDAIKGLFLVCKEPRRKAANWEKRYVTYGRKGWCAWISEIADIGNMTQNTLRPGGIS